MAEKSSIIGNGKSSQLVIPEIYSIFGGVVPGDPDIGLRVTIYGGQNRKDDVIAQKEFDNSSDFDIGANDAKISLPNEFHNKLASNAGRCHYRFYAELTPFDVLQRVEKGNKAYLELGIINSLEINSSATEAERRIDPINNSASFASQQDKPLVSGVTSSQEIQSSTVQQNATAAATAPKKKSPLGIIIGAIVGLILLLLAIFAALYFTGALKGLLGGNNASQTQEQSVEEPQAESEEPASDENLQEQDEQDKDANAEDNSTAQQEPVAEDNTASSSNDGDDEVVVVTKKNQGAVSSSVACSISSSSDDIALIKGCLATKPQAEVVKSLVEESFANNRCNVGKRLLSSYGRRDAQFAYMYGQYFDENSSLSSSCEVKDIDKAIYWYEKAVELGDTTNAKAALDKLK